LNRELTRRKAELRRKPRRAPFWYECRMRARELAEADVARGDLGTARRRLASAVASQPYAPDLLGRIADLSLRMGDPVQAGRYFLLSDRTGAEVDAAVEAFARSCGREPRRMAWELPRFRARWDLAALTPAARSRLGALGVDHAMLEDAACPCCPKPRRERRSDALAGCFAVLLAGIVLVALVVAALRALERWR
jgi:hypothetical protein